MIEIKIIVVHETFKKVTLFSKIEKKKESKKIISRSKQNIIID